MNSKPSLLWISHFLPYPLDLGARIRSFNLILHLADHFNLSLVLLDSKINKTSHSSYLELLSLLGKRVKVIHYIPIASNNSIAQKVYLFFKGLVVEDPIELDFFYSKAAELKISSILSNGFDFTYFDSIDLAKYFPLADLPKAFLNHHNVESSLLQSMSISRKPSFFYRRQARLMKALETKYCGRFKVNFTVSDLDTKVLENGSKGVYHTIPNGVDTDSIAFNPRPRNEIIKLGWLGSLDWNPNSEAVNWFLSQVWPIISNLYPQLEFHIAGKDSDKISLDKIKNHKRIFTTGYLNNIEQYMHSLDIYLVPLLTGGGTRLKILDAFARGTPVLSTSKGAEGIAVKHGKNILIANEKLEFVEIFHKLMANKFDLLEISKNARALVESQYNWRNIAQTMAHRIKGDRVTCENQTY